MVLLWLKKETNKTMLLILVPGDGSVEVLSLFYQKEIGVDSLSKNLPLVLFSILKMAVLSTESKTIQKTGIIFIYMNSIHYYLFLLERQMVEM